MRQAADAMVSTGMIDHGYAYVNIDDCWAVKPGSPGQQPRDAQGNVNPNKRFPDMKAMTDYIHAKGLKAGLYTSPGPLTCAGCVGAYQHEEQDARQFARVGIRLPEVRLVLVRQYRQRLAQYAAEEPRPRRPAEALSEDGRDSREARPRRRVEPLPVRHGRRVEVGARDGRPKLAHRRRFRRRLREPLARRVPLRLRPLRPQRIAEVQRPRRLERSRLRPAGLSEQLEERQSRADAADAQRAVHARVALVPGGRPVDLQRRHARGSTISRSAC